MNTPEPAHFSAEISALAASEEHARAKLLLQRGNAHLERMAFREAQADLDHAARLHREAGRSYDHLRCLHLAATAARLSGDLAAAKHRAEIALTLATPNTPVAVSALTELGETAAAMGHPRSAGTRYEQAAEQGRAAGMQPKALGALLRRAGAAWVTAGATSRAAMPLRQAAELLTAAGELDDAVRARIEECSAWAAEADPKLAKAGAEMFRREADSALAQAKAQAAGLSDRRALADLALLESTLAVYDADLPSARQAARRAQEISLETVEPVLYTTSTLAISELSDAMGDRPEAYRALAVGWATLGDLMGPELGQATFGPKLKDLAERWGEAAFIRVRDAYAESRREA